ncbi:prolyl oligopeptidase family serine peptidase [Micromonospora sp. NPDC126480]|uniref:prolyl oligopeptidase family serine peptidase n=1 Tax=Micromonospora sp. NPDC126480 TaxID=3155312 RepID=UPI00332D2AF4
MGHVPAPGDAATLDCTVTSHVGAGTPVLLMHGMNDLAVPPTQTLSLATALLAAGHPVQVMVTDGAHGERGGVECAGRRGAMSRVALTGRCLLRARRHDRKASTCRH